MYTLVYRRANKAGKTLKENLHRIEIAAEEKGKEGQKGIYPMLLDGLPFLLLGYSQGYGMSQEAFSMQTNYIAQQYDQLCSDLAKLKLLITTTKPSYAQVAEIPKTFRNQEAARIETIVPTQLEGREALAHAAKAYLDLNIVDGLSQKVARRTVGTLVFDPETSQSAREIPECVKQINKAKENIENYVVSTYETRNERFDALKEACPGVMTQHLYRGIRCLDNAQIERMSFTWQRKYALKRPVKTVLLQQIREELNGATSHSKIQILEKLLFSVEATPASQLRIRRAVPPQPSVNIWNNTKVQTLTAPLPIIVIQSHVPAIKPLPSFNADTPRRKRQLDRLNSSILGSFAGSIIEATD